MRTGINAYAHSFDFLSSKSARSILILLLRSVPITYLWLLVMANLQGIAGFGSGPKKW